MCEVRGLRTAGTGQKTMDSLEGVSEGIQQKIDISIRVGEFSGVAGDPKIGSAASALIKNTVREMNKRKVDRELKSIDRKVDSLKKVNNDLKNN